MPDSGEDRERELTELLDEVRALRQAIERLQAGQAGGPALHVPQSCRLMIRYWRERRVLNRRKMHVVNSLPRPPDQ